MKLKSVFVFLLPVLCILVLTTVVLAQEVVPAPYTGLKNPLAWNDATAQTAGKKIYLAFCASCHGTSGYGQNTTIDFSMADYPKKLESSPDFGFWRVSEGIIAKDMAPFKFSLSETQRWQALTYIWSLGGAPPVIAGNTPIPSTSTLPSTATLRLTAPEQAQAGQPLHISALVQDKDGKPIADVPVMFSLNATLFTSGLAEIGEAATDDKGVAAITYTPQLTGNITIDARSQTDSGKFVVATSIVRLVAGSEQLYRTEVGLPYAGFPPSLVVFPGSERQPSNSGSPLTVLRIPGGLPFIPFMAYLVTVILVWSLFVRSMYQVLLIPVVSKKGPNTRLVPLVGIALVVLMGAMMVLVLITGPYSGP